MIIIIPAIDILHDKVVRLYQGDYQQSTIYDDNPANIAFQLQQEGFKHIHIIDLQGAKEGKPFITKHVEDITKLGMKVQVGGGIRTISSAQHYLNLGVEQVIVSTAILTDLNNYHQFVTKLTPQRIIVSLDVKNGVVAIKGWKEQLALTLVEAIQFLNERHPIAQLIITDISRDGTLQGVNVELYRDIHQHFPAICLIAAGGVASMQAIEQLDHIEVDRVIVGRALYEDAAFRKQLIKRIQDVE